MRWRNGRGRTREVASWPSGSTLDAFEWRVSVATVAQDGAFSRFPGVTRTLALIGGAGLRLAGAATRIELAQRYAVASYRGDDEVQCKLLGGEVQLLNVMVRGDARVRIAAVERTAHILAPGRYRVCVGVTGVVQCRLRGDAWSLHPGDALVIDDAQEAQLPLPVTPEQGAAVLVSIDTRGAA